MPGIHVQAAVAPITCLLGQRDERLLWRPGRASNMHASMVVPALQGRARHLLTTAQSAPRRGLRFTKGGRVCRHQTARATWQEVQMWSLFCRAACRCPALE